MVEKERAERAVERVVEMATEAQPCRAAVLAVGAATAWVAAVTAKAEVVMVEGEREVGVTAEVTLEAEVRAAAAKVWVLMAEAAMVSEETVEAKAPARAVARVAGMVEVTAAAVHQVATRVVLVAMAVMVQGRYCSP